MDLVGKRKMVVFTAPSGAGKTTLVRHILENYLNFDFSISATTRSKREKEVDGKDYYFLSIESFKQKIDQNAFVEWEEVYENQFYGTLKSEIERIWSNGKVILFDIDVQGATDIKKEYGNECMVIFVKSPSIETLIERLKARNTESEDSLNKRISKVMKEIEFENSFDAIIINDELSFAKNEAEILIQNFINN
jgi:guanylate kinase